MFPEDYQKVQEWGSGCLGLRMVDSDSEIGEKFMSIPSSEIMETDKFWGILVSSTSIESSNFTFFLFRLILVTSTESDSSASSEALVILFMTVAMAAN